MKTIGKTEKSRSAYKYFVPMMLQDTSAYALIDSGNTWRCVCSEDFIHKLGMTTRDLQGLPGPKEVATAKEGVSLKILGEFRRPICFRLGHLRTLFRCVPVVLEGLSHEFNISGQFLNRYGIDQLHSRGTLRVQGQETPLLAQAGPPPKAEAPLAAIYVEGDQEVSPMATQFIKAIVPKARDGQIDPGDGVATGCDKFMETSDLSAWKSALVDVPEDGRILVGVMNTTASPIKVKSGALYGHLARTTTLQNWAKFPWRVCVLENSVNQLDPRLRKEAESQASLETKEDPAAMGTDVDKEALPSWMRGPLTKDNAEARTTFLLKKFELQNNDLLKDPDLKRRAVALLLKHWDVFSFDGTYGRTNLIKHKIRLKPGTQPSHQRYRPVNPALEGDLKKQLDKWLEQGICEKATSPWNSGLVAAPKHDGSIRWSGSGSGGSWGTRGPQGVRERIADLIVDPINRVARVRNILFTGGKWITSSCWKALADRAPGYLLVSNNLLSIGLLAGKQ